MNGVQAIRWSMEAGANLPKGTLEQLTKEKAEKLGSSDLPLADELEDTATLTRAIPKPVPLATQSTLSKKARSQRRRQAAE